MIKQKSRFLALFLSIIMCLTACSMPDISLSSSSTSGDTDTAESTTSDSESSDDTTDNDSYVSKLFDTSYVHTINVEISDDDWADLLENPTDKTKYEVNVTIDGEEVSDVSFATKGNTSLSSVASDEDSDRYSFKINFGKYVDGQTYYGLDKLNLNNIYADATYMKDYLSYQLFNLMGCDAPLTSYVSLYINGELYGLYLAIENVSDAFLERTGHSDANLYKPETSELDNANMGGDMGDAPDMGEFDGEMPDMSDFDGEMPDMSDFDGEMPDMNGGPGSSDENSDSVDSDTDVSDDNSEDASISDSSAVDSSDSSDTRPSFDDNHQGGGGGGFGSNDNGASLKYTDDEIDSYTDIFDNAETDVTEEDEETLISSLKTLSEGEDVESAVDVDSVIRYFVVHNFVMNYDSYTGNMLHNYYLLEEDGILSMIPWDYNLAFGAFMNQGMNSDTDSTEIVNYGIDSPLSGAEEEDRPMWSFIVNNEEYLDLYHTYYDELVSYFESGEFEEEIERVYEMILPYVEEDPTAFYTADEFETAFETLENFCLLRAESIRKQLDGELSTVTDEQDESDRVDASSITISDMGTQGGDHDGDGGPGGDGDNGPGGNGNGGSGRQGGPGDAAPSDSDSSSAKGSSEKEGTDDASSTTSSDTSDTASTESSN